MTDYKLVPVEPTEAMIRSAMQYDSVQDPKDDPAMAEQIKLDWSLMLSAAPAVQGEPVAIPQISGIGRDTSHPRAVILYLRSEPTDDDIRSIQDAMRPAERRCEYCDGTGDVHSLDGEWRGTCICPAGQQPEQSLTSKLEAPATIDCWACGAPVLLDDRADADGNCPYCSVELDLEEYLRAAIAQPEPDVAGLVEALQTACEYLPIGSRALELASIALAAHRKGGCK